MLNSKKEAIINFRDIKISRAQLTELLGSDPIKVKTDEMVIVNRHHLAFVIESFRDKTITLGQMLDWVNCIWFSELYDYAENENEVIASVMNRLEEADENIEAVSIDNLDLYLKALRNNAPVE